MPEEKKAGVSALVTPNCGIRKKVTFGTKNKKHEIPKISRTAGDRQGSLIYNAATTPAVRNKYITKRAGSARSIRGRCDTTDHGKGIVASPAICIVGPREAKATTGSVATLKTVRRTSREELGGEVSGGQIEQLVDELILFANISVADPPRLPLPDHVHRLVSLNRSPGCLELTKALLGLHASFDRSMILLQDVVQVLDRSMSAAAAQGSFLFHCCNRRAVEAGLISIDDAGLGVRWIAEGLAKQAFGRRRIAQRRQQEVDSGTGGIDGPIEVTPTALHSNIRLIAPPGFVGRLEMTAQPLLQFGTVTLNPAPDRRVIGLQTALGEQLFDIAERQQVPKIPAHGTKNQLRRRLPPLEDCRSSCVLHDLFRLPATPAKVATHPDED